jgi:hypothetical protein
VTYSCSNLLVTGSGGRFSRACSAFFARGNRWQRISTDANTRRLKQHRHVLKLMRAVLGWYRIGSLRSASIDHVFANDVELRFSELHVTIL